MRAQLDFEHLDRFPRPHTYRHDHPHVDGVSRPDGKCHWTTVIPFRFEFQTSDSYRWD